MICAGSGSFGDGSIFAVRGKLARWCRVCRRYFPIHGHGPLPVHETHNWDDDVRELIIEDA